MCVNFCLQLYILFCQGSLWSALTSSVLFPDLFCHVKMREFCFKTVMWKEPLFPNPAKCTLMSPPEPQNHEPWSVKCLNPIQGLRETTTIPQGGSGFKQPLSQTHHYLQLTVDIYFSNMWALNHQRGSGRGRRESGRERQRAREREWERERKRETQREREWERESMIN